MIFCLSFIIITKTRLKFNKKERTIIPVGRCQLGISSEFKNKLEEIGYKIEFYTNPKNHDRLDYRCVNLVSQEEFIKGDWATLFFYGKEELKAHYEEKIVKYLTKNYKKPTRQKAIGSQYVKHNTKIVYDDSDEWSEVQKKFIRQICNKIYTSSRLPIPSSYYQKQRKKIMELYPQYRNFNTLITDYINGKATYKNNILTCPNGKTIKLK